MFYGNRTVRCPHRARRLLESVKKTKKRLANVMPRFKQNFQLCPFGSENLKLMEVMDTGKDMISLSFYT